MKGFDYFWEIYPARNGKRLERGKVEALWKKLSLEDRRAAYRGAIHYAESCFATGLSARDPMRWVRDRCWTDWQDPAEPANGSDPLRRGGPTLKSLIADAFSAEAYERGNTPS